MIGSRAFAFVIAGLGLIGLTWSLSLPVPTIPVVPEIELGPPAMMAALSGMGQSATVGSGLSDALVVRVVDASNTPLPGVPVTFTVTSGGGTLFLSTTATNADGQAATRWSLGQSAKDEQTAEARAVVPQTGVALAVEFKATADVDAPTALLLVSGDGQVGSADEVLPNRLTVRLVDQYGNSVPDASVAWTVRGGGGGVSPAQAVTDARGLAWTEWTPGPESASEQSVVANAVGLPQVEFLATVPVTHTVIFEDGFDRGLAWWTGRNGRGRGHGEVVQDPTLGGSGMTGPRNRVVRFSTPVAAGDLFSVELDVDPAATYLLTFDYLGLPLPGSDPQNTGGFIGLSAGMAREHIWLAGTEPWYDALQLIDDGAWHSYAIHIVPGDLLSLPENGRIRIMLEDGEVAGGVARDAYFDNIALALVPSMR